jgi:hypothetical protein
MIEGMPANALEELWKQGTLLAEAFTECRACLEDFYSHADEILRVSPDIPAGFRVSLAPVPGELFLLRRNLFSTLFQSMYALLGVPGDKRMLYGTLNCLFRTWVTSADNLLDGEDKMVMPMKILGESRVMRQVIAIMTADRVMKRVLDEAVERGQLTPRESALLSDRTLQVLLPSAAEEASEEGGIADRPDPEYVLFTIHRLKTGILFHIPFLGPETIEPGIDASRLRLCKNGLAGFGLGCQLLDDIRDMAKDHLERRHNYILSVIRREGYRDYEEHLRQLQDSLAPADDIAAGFPRVVEPAARRAFGLLRDGLLDLDRAGLGIGRDAAEEMSLSMFKVLECGELAPCVRSLHPL